MSSWCDGFLWNVALENYHGVAGKLGIEPGPNPQIGVPDRSGPKEVMWFDHFIRQSDWLAGTLAAWDREENRLPTGSDKYLRVVEDVLADADNLVILPIRMQRHILNVSRLLIKKAPGVGGGLNS